MRRKTAKASQDWLPNIRITDSMIVVQSAAKRYVKVMEVGPIPYYTMPREEQNSVFEYYLSFIRTAPKIWGVCATTMNTDSSDLIQYLLRLQRAETDDEVRKEIEKYAEWVKGISQSDTVDRRIFLYFDFEKNDEVEGKTEQDIAWYMTNKAQEIALTLQRIGLSVDLHEADFRDFACEILYRYMNPITSREKTYRERKFGMDDDAYLVSGNDNRISIVDKRNYYAPSYVDDRYPRYIVIDGMYYMLFYLTPLTMQITDVPIGWVDAMADFGTALSFSFQFQRMQKDYTLSTLERNSTFLRATVNPYSSRTSDHDKNYRLQNIYSVMNGLRSGEDLWMVTLIVSLKAETLSDLLVLRSRFLTAMKRMYLKFQECDNRMSEAFFMSLPIGYEDQKIQKWGLNSFLSSAVATTFPYTDFAINDPNGAVVAEDMSGKLIRFDPFNTKVRVNANGIVVGMAGSGKTFSMNVFLRHMRLSGVKVRLILPIKGANDYKRTTESVNGTFVQMMPGSPSCVNIFQISDDDAIDSSLIADANYSQKSKLAMKIQEIRTWLILRSRQTMTEEQKDIVDTELEGMYRDFGITTDNNSVKQFIKDKKPFPTFQTFYDRIKDNDKLSSVANSIRMFVDGRCANLNGQTNVDLANKWIAFDVDKTVCGDVLAEYYYIAMSICTADARRNRAEMVLLFYDEVQEVTRVAETAKSVDEQYATMRGFGTGVWCATQQIGRLAQLDNGNGEMSQTIVSNAATKILMQTDSSEVKSLAKELDLTREEVKYVSQPHRGSGLFISGGCHSKVHFISSEEEFYLFNTDPKVERERLMRLKMEQADAENTEEG